MKVNYIAVAQLWTSCKTYFRYTLNLKLVTEIVSSGTIRAERHRPGLLRIETPSGRLAFVKFSAG